MAVIGVMDWDFMHYEHVIPNLECAKLCTYFHNRHEISVLAPELNPQRYTEFYVRKEYNDGIYPKELFESNCTYGGRAFTPDHYSPLNDVIERTIPNMHLYDKYKGRFGPTTAEQMQIKHILNCAHIRLSTDEIHPKTLNQLKSIFNVGRYTGIIFHDYDLARIDGAYDIIYELSHTRHFKSKEGVNPYSIGNKFPIQVTNPFDLEKWLKIISMPNIFSLQYNGIMPNETLNKLCTENLRLARQVWYKIDEEWYGEDHFLQVQLPIIFSQVLLFRSNNLKISLKYDEEKFITPELKNLLDLLNCWLRFTMPEYNKAYENLSNFCRRTKELYYLNWAYHNVNLSIEDARNTFQYVREKNYELFKMFYERSFVYYEGGKIVDDR